MRTAVGKLTCCSDSSLSRVCRVHYHNTRTLFMTALPLLNFLEKGNLMVQDNINDVFQPFSTTSFKLMFVDITFGQSPSSVREIKDVTCSRTHASATVNAPHIGVVDRVDRTLDRFVFLMTFGSLFEEFAQQKLVSRHPMRTFGEM